jgi:phage-related protein
MATLKIATGGVSDAMKVLGDSSSSIDQINAALKDLSPSAQKAAYSIVGLKNQFKDVKKVIQEGFFSQFVDQVGGLNSLFPLLQRQLTGTSKVLGQLVKQGIELAKTPLFQKNLSSIMASNTRSIAVLGTAGLKSFSGLLAVMKAFSPIMERFSASVAAVAAKFDAYANSAKGQKQLTKLFQEADVAVRLLGGTLKNVGTSMYNIFKNAMPLVGGFGLSMLKVTAAFNAFTKSASGQAQIKQFFANIAPLIKQVGGLIHTLVSEIVKIGTDPAIIGGFTRLIASITPILGVLGNIIRQIGPSIIGIVNTIVQAIGKIVAALPAQQLADFLGNIIGVASQIIQVILPVLPIIGQLADIFSNLFQSLSPAITKIAAAFVPFIQTIVNGFSAFMPVIEAFVNAFSQLIGPVLGLLSPFVDVIKSLAGILAPLFPVILAAVKPLIPVITQVVDIFAQGLVQVIGLVADALKQVLPILGPALTQLLTALLPIFKQIIGVVLELVKALVPILPILAKMVADLLPLFVSTLKALMPGLQIIAKVIAWLVSGPLTWLLKIIEPIIHLLGTTLAPILGPLAAAFVNLGGPVAYILGRFRLFGPVVRSVINFFIQLAGYISRFTSVVGQGFQWLWNEAIKPAWDAITKSINWSYHNVILPVWHGMQEAWKILGKAFGYYYNYYLKPIWHALTSAPSFVYHNVLLPIWHGMQAAWRGLTKAFGYYYDYYLHPIWTGITTAVGWVQEIVSRVWETMKHEWRLLGDAFMWVKENILDKVWDGITTAVEALSGVFDGAKSAIKTIWDGIVDVIKAPLKIAIKVISGIDHGINNVLGWIGISHDRPLPEIGNGLPKLKEGGPIGPAGMYGGGDKWPVIGEAGELVVRKETVAQLGGPKAADSLLNRNKPIGTGGPNDGKDTSLKDISGKIFSHKGVLSDAASAVGHAITHPIETFEDAGSWVLNQAEGWLRKGAAAAFDAVTKPLLLPVKAIIGSTGAWGKTVYGLVSKPRDLASDWIRGKEHDAPVTGDAGTWTGGRLTWPVPGFTSIIQKFHPGHEGIDIPAPSGTPTVAANAGQVVFAGASDPTGYGSIVRILGEGLGTLYGHQLLEGFKVKAGDNVKQGDPIGLVGALGNSTGSHLHFEVHPGGFGNAAVDPEPYLHGTVAAISAAAAASTGTGVQRWSALVLQVLGELGLSLDLLPKVLRQMQTESGGDPNAVQGIVDINSANGPAGLARGLMQTIPATFAAYAGPYAAAGIFDPHANIYAGLNYAMHRYGPNLNSLGEGHGYYLGGRPVLGEIGVVGERGFEMWRPDIGQMRIIGTDGPELMHFAEPGNVIPHDKAEEMVLAGAAAPPAAIEPSAGYGTGGQAATVVTEGDSHFSITIQGAGHSVSELEAMTKRVVRQLMAEKQQRATKGASRWPRT